MPKKKIVKKKAPKKENVIPEDEEDGMNELMAAASEKADGRKETEKKTYRKKPAEVVEEEDEELFDSSEEEGYRPPVWEPKFDKKKPISMILLGSSDTGKSYYLRYILSEYMRDCFDGGIVICGTYKEQQNYLHLFEDVGIKATANKTWTQEAQDKIEAEFKRRDQEGLPQLRIAVIFDDQGEDKKYDNLVTGIFTGGRHWGLSPFFCVQAPRMLLTTVKGNSKIIGIFHFDSSTLKRSVIDGILLGTRKFPSSVKASEEKKFYGELLDAYTDQPGDMLIIDQRRPEYKGNTEDSKLFQYRAPPEDDWTNKPSQPLSA